MYFKGVVTKDLTTAMEEESMVRAVVQKNASRTAERRIEKRLAAQSRRRGHLVDTNNGHAEISEKEVKTLVNLCKNGKISVDELKTLSQVGFVFLFFIQLIMIKLTVPYRYPTFCLTVITYLIVSTTKFFSSP